MAFIDGRRSSFPTSVDSFGDQHVNNVCELVTAERFNFIRDALWQVQRHTLGIVKTGESPFFTHSTSGINRPKILMKAFTVSVIGADATVKTVSMPAPSFSSDEKALFNGTPLASGNCIHLQVRKNPGDAFALLGYKATIQGPVADTSGDSGWTVAIAVIGLGDGGTKVRAGTYVISLFITSNN